MRSGGGALTSRCGPGARLSRLSGWGRLGGPGRQTLLALVLAACGETRSPDLARPQPRASFPLYVTLPGVSPGSGAIHRIDAPTAAGIPSKVVPLLTELDFPSGLAVGRSGALYYALQPAPGQGEVWRWFRGERTQVGEGLSDPQGLAIDGEGRLYCAEAGKDRVLVWEEAGGWRELRAGLAKPQALSVDDKGRLYVTGAAQVYRLTRDGRVEEVASGLAHPVYAGPGLVGELFYIVRNSGLGDGRAYRLAPEAGGSVGGEAYLDHLINPVAAAWEDGTNLYLAEGAPSLRVVRHSPLTGGRTEAARLAGEPHSLAFTPRE